MLLRIKRCDSNYSCIKMHCGAKSIEIYVRDLFPRQSIEGKNLRGLRGTFDLFRLWSFVNKKIWFRHAISLRRNISIIFLYLNRTFSKSRYTIFRVIPEIKIFTKYTYAGETNCVPRTEVRLESRRIQEALCSATTYFHPLFVNVAIDPCKALLVHLQYVQIA